MLDTVLLDYNSTHFTPEYNDIIHCFPEYNSAK